MRGEMNCRFIEHFI